MCSTMVVSSGGSFQCEVVRSDWHDEKNMFVTACRYSKRSISGSGYEALLNAPDWRKYEATFVGGGHDGVLRQYERGHHKVGWRQ